MSVLIAAIGSGHGADSLGWEVADRLSRLSLALPSGGLVDVKKYRHPTAMVNDLGSYDQVIFLDALVSQRHQYGELIQLPAADLCAASGTLSSHGTGLNDAVALARAIQTLPVDSLVVGINVFPFVDVPVAEDLQRRLGHAVCTQLGAPMISL